MWGTGKETTDVSMCTIVIKYNNGTIVKLVKRLLAFHWTQWIITMLTLSGCSAC